ncbi:MAG: helix-turn-helix domain-containing protein [Clostridia bacterium]|nr:helix-turn-helix domain-containing protein [Clostridia bacterium]
MDLEILVQNVKRLCALRGVKPTIACRDSGAGKNFINKIETQKSTPSVEKVQLLAQYLGVTTSELLGEETIGPKLDNVPEGKKDAVDALYRQLISLPAEDLQAIDRVVQAMKHRASQPQPHSQQTPSAEQQ